jgi:hypothetical protein
MFGFSDILTIVVPVFVVVAVGYCAGRMHLFDGGRAEALRDLSIQLALPAVPPDRHRQQSDDGRGRAWSTLPIPYDL